MKALKFRKKRYYSEQNEHVYLMENYRVDKDKTSDGVPYIVYNIYLQNSDTLIGAVELHLLMNDYMYYYGNVGYYIECPYRGHHYAYWACKVLFKIANEELALKNLIITCSPDNIASYKTLVKLGGELLETVDVPQDHELYKRGEKVKCIFGFKL